MKTNLDDSLDVFACHGMGGITGALATGLFAEKAVNAAGADGLFFGNAGQFMVQLYTVGVVVAFSFIAAYILAKVVDAMFGLRAKEEEEELGLDISQHGEVAFGS